MTTPPATRDEIDRFATEIGEWLLTQEFGAIKPLAFRHRLGFLREDDGLQPYVVIELLVTDPPDRDALSWPLDDWKAVHEAAEAKGGELGPPPGILADGPVDVRMFGESEMNEDEFPR